MNRMAIANKNKNRIAVFLLLIASAKAGAIGQPATVSAMSCESPDGRLHFKVSADSEGQVFYGIRLDDEPVLRKSRLGILGTGFVEASRYVISETTERTQAETWEQPWGERSHVYDKSTECEAGFANPGSATVAWYLRVRVYDDGVGFRYVLPPGNGRAIAIRGELTEFAIAPEATAIWQPGSDPLKYETLYRRTTVADVENAHSPLTIRLENGVHLSIHEAALVNYPAFTLEPQGDGILQAKLRPRSDGLAAVLTPPFETPWRTIQVSDDAVGLINSDLILNLNEPNKLGDVSYIEPGKFVGIWWALHLGQWTWHAGSGHGATTEHAIDHIDFAAEYGFDGVLVEGWNTGWDGDWVANGSFSFVDAYPDYDLEMVASYARERGVRIIAHNETGGHISRYEDALDDAFALYKSLGMRQVKTGYVGDAGSLKVIDGSGERSGEWHDGQVAVNHHQRVIEAAHDHRLGIIAHEPVKATGLRRTYPNFLSREGSRGQEFGVWGETPNPPEHEVMLAYTRMLAGPMDYTPGIFDLRFRDDEPYPVRTTLMKQLALYVVIYSPVQMVPDLPENYAKYPDAFGFIVDVPTDWTDSIALAGELGEYVVVAREDRNSTDVYIGAITNEEPREIELELGFLAPKVQYTATIYRDGDDAHWRDEPYDYKIETRDVSQESRLMLKLAAGGGTAIRISPAVQAAQPTGE